MANPLVSVALATYNGDAFLEAQLESIIRQDYQPLEILVSDDCSTDQTPFILQRYAKAGKLKYWKNDQNLGYAKNFERIISKCSGECIALADQDDIWDVDKITKLVHAIGNNLLIHSDAVLIDHQGKQLASSFSTFSRKMTFPKSCTEALLNGSVTGCTSLFRRELLADILPFPEGLYVHDKWIGLIAFLKNGFGYLDKPLISYRQHSSNSIGVAQSSLSITDKIRKVFSQGKIDYQFQAFRNVLEKERILVIQLKERVLLKGTAKKEVEAVEKFYTRILDGRNLLGVAAFYGMNLGAFEKNKLLSQKLYYFYLILSAFFYSKRIQMDRLSKHNLSH